MMKINWIKLGVINLSILILFIVDRILKYYFIKNPTIKFGGDFLFGLNFNFEKNFGIAFGILVPKLILIFLVAIIIFVLVNILIKNYKKKNLLLISSLTLIIVGAISNLIDRLLYGFVIDYIDVPWFTVFNLADAMITCGVIVLLFEILFNQRLDKKEKLV